MLALIDGDIVAHRVAWTTENDNVEIARYRFDEMSDGILVDTDATEFQIYLSDRAENNWRYAVYPQYKANRAKLPRPRHLEALKEYAVTKWGAKIAIGQEADDALGIEQMSRVKRNSDDLEFSWHAQSVVCSIDKDLMQIPGQHYNFVKKEWKDVSRTEGLLNFYKQILIGDSSDNIGGCQGIGPVKAERLLGQLREDTQLAREVFKAFVLSTNAKSQEARKELRSYIEKIGRVLKIRQEEEEPLWHFPLENLMEEFQSQSTPSKQGASGPSTEPIGQSLTSGSLSVGEQTESGTQKETQP